MTLARTVKAASQFASARHRRWRRLLRSLDLDPETLSRPVTAPGTRDFIICGSPRSGTSLAAAVLHQPPTSATVMEPWDGMRLPVADLFASIRREIRETGAIRRGRLDAAALEDGHVRWTREGERIVPLDTGPDYLLGVKWPAFWRYLDLLPDTRFVVCVRHPVEVIASYRSVGGRLGEGLDYEIAFNRTMNEHLAAVADEPATRRILLHEYITERILPYLDRSTVYCLRYERWFSEPDVVLNELRAFLDADLQTPTVRIRPPHPPDVTAQEKDRIRALCRTARELGYPI